MLGLYDAIRTAPLQFPDAPRISPPLRDLLQRMLVKDPSQRLGLQEVMAHPWTQTQGLPNLCSLQACPAWCWQPSRQNPPPWKPWKSWTSSGLGQTLRVGLA